MNTVNLQQQHAKPPALLEIGFRIFFLGAGVLAVLSIALWAAVYAFGFRVQTAPLTIFQWHAHEMVYGYSMAVVAGFLLTAVANWTGLTTRIGTPLLAIFVCWAAARVLYLFGSDYLIYAALFDFLFMLQLVVAITIPILKKRMWVRMAVVSKAILLLLFNLVFTLGALGLIEEGVRIGIYGGFYLIIGLILTVGKNLLPFFIARGVGYEVSITNFRCLDIASLVLFLLFLILTLSNSLPIVQGGLALLLFVINLVRLGQWHTQGIWGRPLLWGLYISYIFICLGFLLLGMHHFAGISVFLGIHAFAVGGIGLITLSMMSRVSIGHTGRDISKPPALVRISFLLLIACAVARVLLPLVFPEQAFDWILSSFALWITAFLVFLLIYAPMLIAPRIDS